MNDPLDRDRREPRRVVRINFVENPSFPSFFALLTPRACVSNVSRTTREGIQLQTHRATIKRERRLGRDVLREKVADLYACCFRGSIHFLL